MGDRRDGGRYSGDTFHFNVVALGPLSAHSISTGGKNKSSSHVSLLFQHRGQSWANAVTSCCFPQRALSISVMASDVKENGYSPSFPHLFYQEKKRFKCHFQ